MTPRAFVFLDRDGTLLHDPGYLHRLEDYALLPGVVEGLRELRAAGFALAIVSNQSGIGRGYYEQRDFDAIQARLVADLSAQGVEIEATYFCPHTPDAGCECRKPEPGMLRRAERELAAHLPTSWVVGNAAGDVELARRAGCRAVYVGDLSPDLAPDVAPEVAPDVPRVPGVLEAARLILDESQTQLRT